MVEIFRWASVLVCQADIADLLESAPPLLLPRTTRDRINLISGDRYRDLFRVYLAPSRQIRNSTRLANKSVAPAILGFPSRGRVVCVVKKTTRRRSTCGGPRVPEHATRLQSGVNLRGGWIFVWEGEVTATGNVPEIILVALEDIVRLLQF